MVGHPGVVDVFDAVDYWAAEECDGVLVCVGVGRNHARDHGEGEGERWIFGEIGGREDEVAFLRVGGRGRWSDLFGELGTKGLTYFGRRDMEEQLTFHDLAHAGIRIARLIFDDFVCSSNSTCPLQGQSPFCIKVASRPSEVNYATWPSKWHCTDTIPSRR